MRIETNFDIGDKIWVVYEHRGIVNVYSDTIDSISISEEGVSVWLKDSDTLDLKEDDIILYKDTEKLLKKIKELDNEIKVGEENV